jgi:hypothetical protein
MVMNTMQRAHQWAREHREEYPSYKEALCQGLKLAHAEAREAKEKPHLMEDEAAIWRERQKAYRERVPLLLRDWKAPDYEGRKDFRAWVITQ